MVRRRFPPQIVAAAAACALSFYGSSFCGFFNPSFKWGIILILYILSSACISITRLFYPSLRFLFRFCIGFLFGLFLGLHLASYSSPPVSAGQDWQQLAVVEGKLCSIRKIAGKNACTGELALRCSSTADGRTCSAVGTIGFWIADAVLVRELPLGSVLRLRGNVQINEDKPFLFAKDWTLLEKTNPFNRVLHGLRCEMLLRLNAGSWGPLAMALLLGYKGDLQQGEARLFTEAGCAHVLALSGMHLGILTLLIARLFKKPLGLHGATVLGIVLVVFYLCLAGTHSSLLRAAIMYVLGAIALINGKNRAILPILATSFILQLCVNPASGREISFIFSYAALLSLIIISPFLQELAQPWIPAPLCSPLCASLAAFMGTAAICAAFFGVLRPIGILASLLLVPSAAAFMTGGLLFLLFSLVFPPLASVLSWVLDVLYDLTIQVAILASGIPSLTVHGPVIPLLCWLAAIPLIVYLRRRRQARNRFNYDAQL